MLNIARLQGGAWRVSCPSCGVAQDFSDRDQAVDTAMGYDRCVCCEVDRQEHDEAS